MTEVLANEEVRKFSEFLGDLSPEHLAEMLRNLANTDEASDSIQQALWPDTPDVCVMLLKDEDGDPRALLLGEFMPTCWLAHDYGERELARLDEYHRARSSEPIQITLSMSVVEAEALRHLLGSDLSEHFRARSPFYKAAEALRGRLAEQL